MPQTKPTSKQRLDSLFSSNSPSIFDPPSHSTTPATFQSSTNSSSTSTPNPSSDPIYLAQHSNEPEEVVEEDSETVLVGRPAPSSRNQNHQVYSIPQGQQHSVPSIWQSTSTSANQIHSFQPNQQAQHQFQGRGQTEQQQSQPAYRQSSLPPQTFTHSQYPPHQQSLPLPRQFDSQVQQQIDLNLQPPRPLLANSNSGLLPPTYDAHNFPQTPPELSEAHSGGRFPRWRGWLEKRALERHYNRLDSNALSKELGLSSPIGSIEELKIEYDKDGKPILSDEMAKKLAKKKSWGKGRGDGDALSDEEERLEREAIKREKREQERPPSPIPVLPPLHSHSFGSRFLPHLPSQPLCAVYLDLPPASTIPNSPGRQARGVALQTQYGKWGNKRRQGKNGDQSRRSNHQQKPKIPPSRRVLLIGTAEGIFACEMRKEKGDEFVEELHDLGPTNPNLNKGKGKETETGRWNGGIRVVQIWSGVGIYQLSVLASNSGNDDSPDSSRPTSPLPHFNSQPNSTSTSPLPTGILLALTAPVPKPSSNSRVPLNKLAAVVSAFESASSSNHGHGQRPQSSHSSSSHAREPSHSHHSHSLHSTHSHSHSHSLSHEFLPSISKGPELASANFGAGGGGGTGVPIPPSGTGSVKMWSLEVFRKLAVLALEGDLVEPLDLIHSEASKKVLTEQQNAKFKISNKLKKAWATLGDNASDRAARREASGSSQNSAGPYGNIDPLLTQSFGRRSNSRPLSSNAIADDDEEQDSWGRNSPNSFGNRPAQSRRASSPSLKLNQSGESYEDLGLYQDRSPISNFKSDSNINPVETIRSQAMKLALSSVSINSSPGGGSNSSTSNSIPLSGTDAPSNLGSGPSFSSLFSEDSLGGGNSSHNQHEKSKSKSARDSNGVLFYSIHEAGSEEKGRRGTWYLALTTGKAIMLYEAQPSKKEDLSRVGSSTRSFRFLRELYAPFSPVAIAFVTCNTSEQPIPISSIPSSVTSSSSSSTTTLNGGNGGVGNAKLSVGNASGPLLTTYSSKQGKPSPSIAKEVLNTQYSGGNAAPIGWKGADLSLFVSFGKRAVMIRVSDSHVREIELLPASLMTGVSPAISSSPSMASLSRDGTLMEPPNSQRRPRSIDALAEKSTIKSPWVGVSTVEARINFRQRKNEEDGAEATAEENLSSSRPSTMRSASGGFYRLAPTAAAWKQSNRSSHPGRSNPRSQRQAASESTATASARDKSLPAVPAPQSLSFDPDLDSGSTRRDESYGTSSSGHIAGAEVFTSDSSSDDYDLEERGEALRSMSLGENGGSNPMSAATSPSSSPPPPSRSFMRYKSKKAAQLTQEEAESTHTISASLALMSKGLFTQVLPSPLPPVLTRPKPLGFLEWSSIPSAVTGMARVVGIERQSSKGFTTTSNLRSHGSPANSHPQGPVNHNSDRNSSMVILRINVTAIAFITSSSPSRIEMKRTLVKLNHNLPFKLYPSCELQISLPPTISPQLQPASSERGPILDSSERTSLSLEENQSALEIDYLGGMLLNSPFNGGGIKGNSSLGKHWRPEESAGDGGAFGWSWRGGDDYRIFFVGAEV